MSLGPLIRPISGEASGDLYEIELPHMVADRNKEKYRVHQSQASVVL